MMRELDFRDYCLDFWGGIAFGMFRKIIWTLFSVFLQPFIKKPYFLPIVLYFEGVFRPPNFSLSHIFIGEKTPPSKLLVVF